MPVRSEAGGGATVASARSAIGVAASPRQIAVEVEMIVEVQ